MNKFYNRALIGNKNLVAGLSEKGELLRVCYPQVDGRQFVDFFKVGVKINDTNLINLNDNVNNNYSQEYEENTNVLTTTIKNDYFKFIVEQTDAVMLDENILIKRYILKNNNSIDMDTKFIVNCKILSGNIERYGSKILEKGIMQYNHNYSFTIFSNYNLADHKLNDVDNSIVSGDFNDKDYIGMSNEVAISYDLGIIKPGEKKEIFIFISVDDVVSLHPIFDKYNKKKWDNEIEKISKFWKKYVANHSKISLDENDEYQKKILKIYNRTILLYPLLINHETGGIAAAMEVDENREKSGSYGYCWTRDAVFIAKALRMIGMENEVEKFYNSFCKNTQLSNGMWEQRYYTDLRLAPCWGYQIDETASVVYGVYDYFEATQNKEFLEKNLKMCEDAIKFLCKYVENILNVEETDLVKKEMDEKNKDKSNPAKQVSYDLWEMHEGIHIYSLSSIISAFDCMKKIYDAMDTENDPFRIKKEKRNNVIKKLDNYSLMLKDYIKENLIDKKKKILKRNTNDDITDICVMGTVYPFEIFEPDDKVITNTVDKINMTLKTYSNGYLRFENDSYMGGNNPWVITTLWMALYYIKSGNIEEAKKCFKYVVDTSCNHGFLSEQVSNENKEFKWVIGLGWSHAMFIIVLKELIDKL